MIDDLALFLKPAAPARLTNLVGNPLSQFVGKRCEADSRALLTAMLALDRFRYLDLL